MSKNSENSNNADLLVLAMKRVFKEAVEDGGTPLVELVGGIEKNMATKADLDITNKNMHDQFAEQPKLVSQEVHKILERKSGK